MNAEMGNIVKREINKNLNSLYYEKGISSYYEDGIELVGIRDKKLTSKDYEDKESLNKMIDFYINHLYKNYQFIPRNIQFKIFNNELLYYVEEEKLENKSSDYIEVSKNGLYTESDVYSSTISFYRSNNIYSYPLFELDVKYTDTIAYYTREARELDGKILSTDIIITDDIETIKLLEEDCYIKDTNHVYSDKNAYYKEYEKELLGESINVISDDFRSSKTYDYLSKTYFKNLFYNSLGNLKSFQNQKLLLSMIYKKMNKKFLKRSKIKGLKRRENN